MDPSDKFDYQDLFGSDMDLDANDTGSSSGITGDLVSRAGTDENQHVGQPGQTVPVPGEADRYHSQAANTDPIMPSPMLPNTNYNTGYMLSNQPSTANHFPLDPTSTSAANSGINHLHEAPTSASPPPPLPPPPRPQLANPIPINSPNTHTAPALSSFVAPVVIKPWMNRYSRATATHENTRKIRLPRTAVRSASIAPTRAASMQRIAGGTSLGRIILETTLKDFMRARWMGELVRTNGEFSLADKEKARHYGGRFTN
ncbi:hypothetical protein B0H65DRAFT_470962 [Neurospora tetraspora]|uniref:Uncharacterized protein n=1 Tax=Neurospora tetraspora TaxID=94610 RepID=A0AAE0JEI5_9PEZI|nr:hypothetical protein B0H65DRAFT_470962 [Neurospora tetraspora]